MNRAKFPEEDRIISTNHEQRLRRALLNSKYFNQNNFDHLKELIKSLAKQYFFNEVLLISGLVLAVISAWYLNGLILPSKTLDSSQVSQNFFSEMPEIQIQKWFKNGNVTFSHEKEDGTRVYKIKLTNSSGTMELYDKSPYIIKLISTNK